MLWSKRGAAKFLVCSQTYVREIDVALYQAVGTGILSAYMCVPLLVTQRSCQRSSIDFRQTLFHICYPYHMSTNAAEAVVIDVRTSTSWVQDLEIVARTLAWRDTAATPVFVHAADSASTPGTYPFPKVIDDEAPRRMDVSGAAAHPGLDGAYIASVLRGLFGGATSIPTTGKHVGVLDVDGGELTLYALAGEFASVYGERYTDLYALWLGIHAATVTNSTGLHGDMFRAVCVTLRVAVKLMGRAGNQMFQYAAAVAYGAQHGKEPYMVNSSGHALCEWLPKDRLIDAARGTLYTEVAFEYVEIPKTPGDVILCGYFQSFQYINRHWPAVKSALAHPRPAHLRTLCDGIASLFAGKEFVGVHCRFGDYVALPDHHPIPTQEYYVAGLRRAPANAVILLYTDDFTRAREYACFDDRPVYEVHETDTDTLGIVAALATHHVIANSSFSWWAAVLSECPRANITMPAPWFGKRAPARHTLHLAGATVVNYVTGEECIADGGSG